MTPYEQHAELGHKLSRYSPNGIDIIEECDDCPMRWLHSPTETGPMTLRPLTQAERESPNRSMAVDGLDRVRCKLPMVEYFENHPFGNIGNCKK